MDRVLCLEVVTLVKEDRQAVEVFQEEGIQLEEGKVVLQEAGTQVSGFQEENMQVEEHKVVLQEVDNSLLALLEEDFRVEEDNPVAVYLKEDTTVVPTSALNLPETRHWEHPVDILEVLVAFQAVPILLKLHLLEAVRVLEILM